MNEHYCTEKCNCPECGHPCHYSPRLNLHACSNVVYCRWKEELPDWRKQADALDLKSRDAKHREGSIPSSGTISFKGMPVHICEKAPRDCPMVLPTIFTKCPYCEEDLSGLQKS